MATYNGDRFILEQLESLANQTRLPDELVVSDDCSEDGTVELVEEFARRAPFPVRIHTNGERMTCRWNFLQAASLCSGDVLAFSDQDDVWLPDKLSCCLAEFEADPDVLLVVHGARVVDEKLTDLGRRCPEITRRVVTSPNVLGPRASQPGFALVAARAVVDICDPNQDDRLTAMGLHDAWVPFLADSLGKVVYLPSDLVLYRRHQTNHSGQSASAGGKIDTALTSLEWHGSEDARLRGRRDSALAKAELCDELRTDPAASITSLTTMTAVSRAEMWRQEAAILERRADLYAAPILSAGAGRRLVSDVLRGDYGRRSRYRLGLASFARDLLYVIGLLDLAARRGWRQVGRA
jgi:hypothetical protein